MNPRLTATLKRIEALITRPAEAYDDPAERQAEFQRRLERTRRLMAGLGQPHEATDIIHIAGTSGKGSIAILCEAMLHAQGLRVGTHTSPYLQTPLEKVRINSRLVSEADTLRLADDVMAAVERVIAESPELGKPHYAEAWLALALLAFASEGCDVSVIEAGMGGRYDASNIVTPRVSVISTVHYDHVKVLGDTLEGIAFHKAGVIKAGVPVVVGEVPEAAWEVIERESVARGARVVRLGHDVRYEPLEVSARGGRFNYHGLRLNMEDVHLGLLGAHQFANATAALAALEVYAAGQGITLDEAALRDGLAAARFAGRLEVMQTAPQVVLDGAHNEEKIGALIQAIPQVFDYERLILVLGMLETKAADPMLAALADITDAVIATSPQVKGKPAVPAAELAALAEEAGARQVIAHEEPKDALDAALALAEPGDLVMVSGSLYLIGEVRSRWHSAPEIVAQHTMFPNGMPEG